MKSWQSLDFIVSSSFQPKEQNMLQHEDIAKVEEIKGKFKTSWLDLDYLSSYLDILGFHKIKRRFNTCKKSGVSFEELIGILLVLPIIGFSSIHAFTSNKENKISLTGKDPYYRLLANQFINWRSLLFSFVKEYLAKELSFTPLETTIKCLIFDDTDLPKSGKTIEGISKIFNHVDRIHFFGFKLLVAGYWNGSIFLPVDFSFHRENKTSKNKYGLTPKQRKKQKKTPRDKKTRAYKRYKELNIKKTDMLIKMFSRICKRNIDIDYILFDSWFTCMSLIKKLQHISKKVHVIGMYKYNSKITVGNEVISLKEFKKKGKKPQRCRKLNYYYHRQITEIDGVKIAVIISKRGVNGKWYTIVSTNTKLSFIEIIEIYGIRWTIEVFFKEAKQLFKLGSCQSTNFDVQIAHTTIIMIQYLLVSIRYRMEAYETIGGMFKNLKQDYIEYKLNDRILAIVYQIIDFLENIIDNIDLQSIVTKLINHSETFLFQRKVKNPVFQ